MSRKSTFTKLKKTWKEVMHFLNEDESIWSLLANIVIAFVLIRYIIYPTLGLLLGTQYPIVAVVSGSMEHDGTIEEWWDSPALVDNKKSTQGEFYLDYEITVDDFKKFPFKNGFNTGDIMVLVGTTPEKTKVGDVIVFQSSRPDPIIHRVIEKNINNDKIYLRTKGDHNPTTYSFEGSISGDEIVGKAYIRIPFLGWIKIAFVKSIMCVADLKSCFA
jgi:signal peptidase I